MEKISLTHVSLKPISTATTLNSPSLFCPNLGNIVELHGHRRSITIIGNKSLNKKSTLRCYQHKRATSGRTMNDAKAPSSSPRLIKLEPVEATPESFHEFGQVIESGNDVDEYGPNDAQLDLTRGIPRFYIMHLEDRALKFSTITHHASVTQCLGSIGGHVWYIGVAKPSIVNDPNEIKGSNISVQCHCGHFYVPPNVDDVVDHTTHSFVEKDNVIFTFDA